MEPQAEPNVESSNTPEETDPYKIIKLDFEIDVQPSVRPGNAFVCPPVVKLDLKGTGLDVGTVKGFLTFQSPSLVEVRTEDETFRPTEHNSDHYLAAFYPKLQLLDTYKVTAKAYHEVDGAKKYFEPAESVTTLKVTNDPEDWCMSRDEAAYLRRHKAALGLRDSDIRKLRAAKRDDRG
ncbi:hypothetical protein FQN52_007063 [Onygenales sp. PD_12]|nr:hypothetical protein FQN52_007063 [Onygenales sp. PD_12]KAK2793283.1 hypothetical protein FQN51_001279 [Onygenales sp. PD_10]